MSIARASLAAAISLSLALSLTACGGGGGGNTRPTPPPPAPAPAPAPAPPSAYSLPSVPPPPPSISPITAGPIITDQTKYLTVGAQATNIPSSINGAGITVGVIDTGADTNTSQLKDAHIIRVNCPICTEVASDPSEGTVNTGYMDSIGHGTLVSEIIGGQAWNYQGQAFPAGLAPGAGLIIERVALDGGPNKGALPEDAIVAGAVDAFNHGAKILNFSNGGGGVVGASGTSTDYSPYQASFAQAKAITQAGGLLVFSAGNDSGANPEVSSALPTLLHDTSVLPSWIVSVALDPANGKLASYSDACGITAQYCLATIGTSLNAAGTPNPAVTIYPSGTTENTPLVATGTSISAPVVSAVGALVWQKFPWMTGGQVGETLLGTATPMGTGVGDPTYGWGLLNANEAINGPANLAWGTFAAQTDGGTYTFSNDIFGAGGLSKAGSGTLILTGNDHYTGPTTVAAGTLEIDGTVRTGVSVGTGATLQGSGLIAGNVGVTGGTVISGLTHAGAGTVNTGLSVVGAYTQDAQSTYGIVIGSPLKAQTASIAGAASVLGIANGYTPQGTETVLWTKAGLTGTFSSVTAGSGVLLSATPSYTPYEADLTISSISATSAVASVTSASVHAVETAAHVQSVLDAANPIAHDAIASGTATASQASLLRGAGLVQQVSSTQVLANTVTSLSGEAHPTATALVRSNMATTNESYLGHFTTLPLNSGHQAWFQVQDGGTSLGRAGYSQASSSTHGLVAGLDVTVNPNWLLGIGVQSSQVNAGVAGVGGRDTLHDAGISLYAQVMPSDDFYANGRLSAGHLGYQIEHTDSLGGVSQRAQANYSGQYAALDVETGYRFHPDQTTTLTPVLDLHADRLHTNGFSETGVDAFGLTAAGQSTTETSGSLGLRASRDFDWLGGHWSANAHALWTHLFAGYNPSLRAAYEGAPADVFGITGVGLPQNSWDTGVGLMAHLGSGWTVGVNYDRLAGHGARSHEANVSASWAF